MERITTLDQKDTEILRMLQEDCRISLEKIADILGVPKSTVHYRVRRLEEKRIIEGYYAKINTVKVGKDYSTVTLIRAEYGTNHHENLGEIIAQIPGVWAVYVVFGEPEFVVITRASNREESMRILGKIMKIEGIENSNTMMVVKTIKEDPRLPL